MKRLITIIALTFCITGLSAQHRKPTIIDRNHLNVSVHGRYSHMLDAHGLYDNMISTYGSATAGVQVGLDTHPSDSSWWANAYNYPQLLLGFTYDNTGGMAHKTSSRIGDFYNLYVGAQFDIVRAGIFSFGPVFEVGMAFTPYRFDPVKNPLNIYIGSNVLANISGGLEFNFRFLPQWEAGLTAYLTHHSNGMFRVPNHGVNQASFGAKLKYYMAPQETDKRIELEKPLYPKGLKWNIYAGAGVHSCDVERMADAKLAEEGKISIEEAYPAKRRIRALVGVEAAYRYHPLLSTGIGIEGNYAGNEYRENDLILEGREDPKGYSPFYSSIHIVQNLHYDAFSLHVAWGVYTFKRVGLTEDMGRCFQRIGARYHFPQFRKMGQMFLGFDMRAHFLDRSYCLELSAGITL